jgi:hypothetical protein
MRFATHRPALRIEPERDAVGRDLRWVIQVRKLACRSHVLPWRGWRRRLRGLRSRRLRALGRRCLGLLHRGLLRRLRCGRLRLLRRGCLRLLRHRRFRRVRRGRRLECLGRTLRYRLVPTGAGLRGFGKARFQPLGGHHRLDAVSLVHPLLPDSLNIVLDPTRVRSKRRRPPEPRRRCRYGNRLASRRERLGHEVICEYIYCLGGEVGSAILRQPRLEVALDRVR